MFRFDPAACTLDAGGRLFIRFPLGYQFAFPMDLVGHVHTGAEDLSGLPRNTAEPEGCPDNPMTMLFLWLRWVPGVGAPGGEAPDRGWFNVPGEPENWAPLGHRLHGNLIGGPQVLREGLTGVYEVFRDDLRPFASDLQIFRGPPGAGMPSEDSTAMVIARPNAYPMLHGLPFLARCNSAFRPGGRKLCWAHYALREGLSVTYRFRTDAVPLEDILRFDRHIQGYIAHHRIAESNCALFSICGGPTWQP